MFALARLAPRRYLNSIYDLDLDELRRQGIRGIITDLDNTLVAWDSDRVSPELVAWLSGVKAAGFEVCLVSNNGVPRVEPFARALGLPAIHHAGKPFNRAFVEAMSRMGTGRSETAVIGDQIFTDVFGGNRLGLYTILVVPITGREFIGTRMVRILERMVLRWMERRGLLTIGK